MNDFFALPSPYVDFALVAVASPEQDIEMALQRIRSLGFYYEIVGDSGTGRTVFVSASKDGVNTDECGVFGMSGIGKDNKELVVPWMGLSRKLLEELDPETGCFTTFDVGPDRSIVKTDLFGYGQSFISQHAEFAIVSNRLHFHKLLLAAFSIPIYLDPAAVIASLFSEHGFFTQQSALGKTMIEGVRLVPVSSDVIVENATIRCIEKEKFAWAMNPPGEDYDSLITKGIAKVIENARVVVETPLFETAVVDLSGGKDSRLVFGAITQIPNWRNKARVNTSRVPNSHDVEVSAGIVNYYDVAYFTGDAIEQYPLTLEDNLRFWRSYFFGQYHRMAAGAWSNEGKNHTSISVGGANGEVYRSFWSSVVDRYIEAEQTSAQFTRHFIRSVAIKDSYTPEQLDSLIDALSEELESYPAKTIRGKIEDHYMFNRNRSHCGLRGFTFYHDRLTWYPLLSADLLAATRLVSDSERSNNRVIYDVLRGLDPKLLAFRFDGPKDPFGSLRDDDDDDDDPLVVDESVEQWEASLLAASSKIPGRRAGRTQRMAWPDLQDYVANEARKALAELRAMKQSTSGLIPQGLEERLEKSMLTPSIGYQLASRILAVWDAVRPVEFGKLK